MTMADPTAKHLTIMNWRQGYRQLVGGLAVAMLAFAGQAAEPRLIFEGTTLAGWEGDRNWWRVEDGAITGEIPAGAACRSRHGAAR